MGMEVLVQRTEEGFVVSSAGFPFGDIMREIERLGVEEELAPLCTVVTLRRVEPEEEVGDEKS